MRSFLENREWSNPVAGSEDDMQWLTQRCAYILRVLEEKPAMRHRLIAFLGERMGTPNTVDEQNVATQLAHLDLLVSRLAASELLNGRNTYQIDMLEMGLKRAYRSAGSDYLRDPSGAPKENDIPYRFM